MKISETIKQVICAVKTRETFPCASTEYENANNEVDKLIDSIKSEDLPIFNREINKPENWQ